MSIKTTGLNIALWNANGLTQHAEEVKTFINIRNIDIMLISETHFTIKSYFKLPKYSIYNTAHPDGTAHGGTAIIIKNSIKHYEQPKYRKEHLQSTSIIIEDWFGPLTIAAVYCPPKHSITKSQFEEFFQTLGNKFIIGGDYNSKHTFWGSRLINPRGRQLYLAMENRNLKHISTGEPTYWPSDIKKIPDLLDFYIIKGISKNNTVVQSNFDLSSDHSPILITLNANPVMKERPLRLCNKLTDWNQFREILDRNLNLNIQLKTNQDLDEAVKYITENIQRAAWSSTPELAYETKPNSVPINIKEKIAFKRRMRRRWQQTRAPADKTKLNKITQELKALLKEYKNNSIQHYLTELSASKATEYSLWKATKKISRPQCGNPPIRTQDGKWAKNDKDKANCFASYFQNVFNPHPNQNDEDSENEIHEYLSTPYQLEPPIDVFKTKKIKQAINMLNHKKSPGYDLITPKILSELPNSAIKLITYIYNSIVRIGFFPSQWKVAVIILIPKPGKPPEEVSSYRPISLLPTMAKLLEKLIKEPLEGIMENKKAVPNHQFGFRSEHGTIEQIHRITSKIFKDLEEKKYCSAVFLDISQAFDRVWHTGLLYKTKQVLPLNYYLIIKSYLENRHFLVKYGDEQSSLHPINAGVPQGSVLGPLLYLLFTADLPTRNNVTTATFADDTAILTSHINPQVASQQLQKSLDMVQKWMEKWRIRANGNKSVHVTFTNRRGTCPPVTLNNLQIPQREEAKYLGMYLDRRLTWKKHLFVKRKQLGLKLRNMYWLLGRKSQLSIENKVLVYKSILKPVWTYGVQLWGSASNSNIEILERFQSKVLRMISDAPWYVPNIVIASDLQVPSVKDEIKRFYKSYTQRLSTHPNQLAKRLSNQPLVTRRLKRHIPGDALTRF